MKWSDLWHLGIVLMLVSVAAGGIEMGSPNDINGYEESQDIILAAAYEGDFPALYGYGNQVFSVYGKIEVGGSAIVTVSLINLTSISFVNITAGTVSPENLTEETTAPAIASHNNSIYAGWSEKEGIVFSVIEGGTLTNTTRIGNIANYYHAPSIAAFGKKVMVTFVCGNQTENATLVCVERDENGNLQMTTLGTLSLDSQKPRKPACGYDIYGHAHVFLTNYSEIEHYYSNGTAWQHEKLGTNLTAASEVNLRFVNNQCFLGFMAFRGQSLYAMLGRGEIGLNGSIGEIEIMSLSTSAQVTKEDLYFTERVYIAQSGSKTLYVTWSENDLSGNLTGRAGKVVGGELAAVQPLGLGKICGVFAEPGKLHTLIIENGYLHYKIFEISRDEVQLAIIGTTPTTVTLGWSRCYDEDFAIYEVHCSSVANFTPSLATLYSTIYDSEQTEESVENLELGKEFFFLVVVRFTGDEILISNSVAYKTPAPVEQVNTTVSDVGSDRFTVSWEQKNCEKFEVHFSSTPGFGEETVVELNNTTTSYTFDSLEPGTTYFVFVRSTGFYGEYADSQIISVLTKPEILRAEVNVDEITIYWQKPGVSFFEKMEVYASTNISTVFESASIITTIYDPSVSTLQIRLEKMNTTFYFGTIIYNTLWQSAESNIVSNTTYLPVLPEVSITKYEILNITSVRIYFPPTDYGYFSRLEIHLSLEKDFTPTDKTLLCTICTQGETTHVIYGLTPDVDYYVRIVLVDIFEQKSISEPLKVRTTGSIECEHPEREIPFYLYGILLIIFFISSTVSGIYIGVTRKRK
ncbi:MAG: fibronectin type III domain-containing protein [Thermoplasmata archaeon]|nr:fibronectin type III domain-containing protein [Thermoplasmata archaeon]